MSYEARATKRRAFITGCFFDREVSRLLLCCGAETTRQAFVQRALRIMALSLMRALSMTVLTPGINRRLVRPSLSGFFVVVRLLGLKQVNVLLLLTRLHDRVYPVSYTHLTLPTKA